MSFLEPTFSTAPSRAQTWPGNHVALSEYRMPSVTLNPLAPWIIWIPLNIANLVASPIFRRIFFTGTSPWHGAKLLNYCYIHEGPGELARALIAASSREQQQPFFFPERQWLSVGAEMQPGNPCVFYGSLLGCDKGVACNFCHLNCSKIERPVKLEFWRECPPQIPSATPKLSPWTALHGEFFGQSGWPFQSTMRLDFSQKHWISVLFQSFWSVPHVPRKVVNFLRLVQKNHQVTPEKSS